MLTIGNVNTIESRLVNIENQIRQFKTTQNYGMEQIKYFSSNSVSANAETWYYPSLQKNIYGIHMVVEFVGLYVDKGLVADAIPTITNYSADSQWLQCTVGFMPTSASSPNILRWDVWAQQYDSSAGVSSSFTVNISVRANMEGVLSLISSEAPQGLIEVNA